MKRSLPKSFSQNAFQDVWKNSRDRSRHPGAPGVDRVTAVAFGERLRLEIAAIRRELADGRYQFKKLYQVNIEKRPGKYRIIAIPTVRDRLVQRVALRHLNKLPSFSAHSDISFGFIADPEKTMTKALERACQLRKERPWVLKADIVGFFDAIQRSDIKTAIDKSVRSRFVADLLKLAVDCELADGDAFDRDIAKNNGIQRGRGLRQGMPVSPMLSNLLLRNFDKAVKARKLSALRYADDIIVFCQSKSECDAALEFIQGELAKLKLKIADPQANDKTVTANPTDVIEFLGAEIRRVQNGEYALYTPAHRLKSAQEQMSKKCTLAMCLENRQSLGEVAQHLEQFIGGHVTSARIHEDVKDFEDRLRAHKKQVITQLVVELIGSEAAACLDDHRKMVLGLMDFPPKKPKGEKRRGR